MENREQIIIDLQGLPIRGMRFSSDSRLLATTGADADLRLWNTATWKLVHQIHGRTPNTRAIAFSTRLPLVAVGELYGAAVYNVSSGEPVARWELTDLAEDESLWSLVFDDEKREIIGVTIDENASTSRVLTWSIGGAQIGESNLNEIATAISFDNRQPCIETYDARGSSRAYRLRQANGNLLLNIDLRGFVAGGIPISVAGHSIVALGNRCFGSAVQIVESLSGKLVLTRLGNPDATPLIAMSPDGKFIAILLSKFGHSNSELSMIMAANDVEIWRGGVGMMDALQFSPDGRFIVAVSSDDHVANIFDVVSGRLKRTIPHSSRSCCFSPDSHWFVSSAGSLFISDVASM